jgi:catechol 2,3-dioxygenase-like lactoylglutathione lyase family enzyme
MFLNHVGIINKSEEDAFRFYRDFLGLELIKEYVVPAELSVQIFSVNQDIKMLVFEKAGAKVEVFIYPEYEHSFPPVSHYGLLLDNFPEIVEKAPEAGVELIIGKAGEKTVYFIRDFSGNPVEIKQA